MKKVKKMAAGGYPAISVGVPGTPTYKRQTPTGKISTTPPPVSPPKGGPVRPTPTPPPIPVRPTPTAKTTQGVSPLDALKNLPKAPPGQIASAGLATFPALVGKPSSGLQPPVLAPGAGDTFKSSGTPPSFGQAMSGAGFKTGMKKGGKVLSASKRADGIATKGKTRGKIV